MKCAECDKSIDTSYQLSIHGIMQPEYNHHLCWNCYENETEDYNPEETHLAWVKTDIWEGWINHKKLIDDAILILQEEQS